MSNARLDFNLSVSFYFLISSTPHNAIRNRGVPILWRVSANDVPREQGGSTDVHHLDFRRSRPLHGIGYQDYEDGRADVLSIHSFDYRRPQRKLYLHCEKQSRGR